MGYESSHKRQDVVVVVVVVVVVFGIRSLEDGIDWRFGNTKHEMVIIAITRGPPSGSEFLPFVTLLLDQLLKLQLSEVR